MKNISFRKILPHLTVFLFIAIPFTVYAQEIVPCGTDAHKDPCTFKDLPILLKNLLNVFIVYIYAPLASLTVMYMGLLFVREQAQAKQKAKKILWNLVIGTFFVLGAWVIVNFVVTNFLKPDAVNIPSLSQ